MQKVKDIDAILFVHFRANKTFPGKFASVAYFYFAKTGSRGMGGCTDRQTSTKFKNEIQTSMGSKNVMIYTISETLH